MSHPGSFRDNGTKSGTVPDVPGRLATMLRYCSNYNLVCSCKLLWGRGGGGAKLVNIIINLTYLWLLFACAWVLFVNMTSLLSWLATHKPKSCTLPTQSAHDHNLEGTGSHLQINNPAAGSVVDSPLLDKAQSISQVESSDAVSMTVPISLEPNNPHQPILRPFPKRTFGKQQRSFCSS